MSKLADLRSNPPASRPERSYDLCLVPHLVAEVESLTQELAQLAGELAQLRPADDSSEAKRSRPPSRSADGPDPRIAQIEARDAEIRARLGQLLAEMAEHEGQMRLRAKRSDGEWRMWCDEHPAREEGEPGYDRDVRVTKGYCNADDLLDDLATYAYAWDGDLLADGDFAGIFEPNIASADKSEMARLVVSMYESRLDFQQLRSSLSTNLLKLSDSKSLSHSDAPTSGSTGGSPEPSNGATTATGTASH